MMPSLWGLGQPGDRDLFVDGDHRFAMWDAAYVLGSLSATDRREFEAHMAGHCHVVELAATGRIRE